MYNSDITQSNLREAYDSLSFRSYVDGFAWYKQAHGLCKSISEEYSVPLHKVVGVCAALSPQKSWEMNQILLKRFFESDFSESGHTTVMHNKCIDIVNLRNKSTLEEVIKILQGPKISCFFDNMLFPDSSQRVTVDRHHIRICTGEDIRTVTKKQYDFYEDETRKFAKEVDILPCKLQSMLWVNYKS